MTGMGCFPPCPSRRRYRITLSEHLHLDVSETGAGGMDSGQVARYSRMLRGSNADLATDDSKLLTNSRCITILNAEDVTDLENKMR